MAVKKIAVIGGGLGSITAIFNITKDPDWKQKYDITVYQMGWRIGGKGASGVNPEYGYRIEEHGLHLWMGFYENAFTMMRQVYAGLNRPIGTPLATFDDAFKGQSSFTFCEHVDGQYIDWNINFPKPLGIAGDGHVPTTEEIIANIFYMMWEMYLDFKQKTTVTKKGLFQRIIDWIKNLLGIKISTSDNRDHYSIIPEFLIEDFKKLEHAIAGDIEHLTEKLFLVIAKMMANLSQYSNFDLHISLIKNLRKWIWDEIGELIHNNTDARRLWTVIDFGLALLHGIFNDKVLKVLDKEVKLDFNAINQYDYADWLVMNGADRQLTISSPLVVSMYDGPFAFLKGNKNQPNIEAGTILNIFLRLGFTCKENFVWRMQAGMGDTIFAPAYEYLIKEGKAKFKFFHKVKNLKLSADKKSVEEIEIGLQVNLKNGTYNPLLNVNNLNCWPSHPVYSYIDDAEAAILEKDDINLESQWANWEDRETFSLKKGIDFDEIILGASLGSMPIIAKELIDADTNWQKMVQNVKTVQTQAYQFWFNQSPEVLKAAGDKLLSTYVEPVDTFCAMNQLLVRESWPVENQPKYVCYLCGAMPEAAIIPPPTYHQFPKEQYEVTKQRAADYIKNNFSHIVPGAYDSEGKFIFDYLNVIGDVKGEARFDDQYFRCNIDPSELYVMSVSNSSKFRLKTNESGFKNLYLTGDWIQNGLNAGFVEGAVTSGLLTARAVTGNNQIPIVRAPWEIWD
jgi:uncharacterized protein with NAD-binding domain and iron-sulfur cluster